MGLNELERYGIAGVAVVIVIILLVSLGGGTPKSRVGENVGEEIPLPGLAAGLHEELSPSRGVATEAGAEPAAKPDWQPAGQAQTVTPAGGIREDFNFDEWPRGQAAVAHVVEAVDVDRSSRPRGDATLVRDKSHTGTYTVRRGDSLWVISDRMLGEGSRWKEIVAANPGLSPRRLHPGRKLRLPRTGAAVPQRSKGRSKTVSSKRDLSEDPPEAPGSYRVRKGDSLEVIAKRVYGKRSLWRRIYEVNRKVLRSPNRLAVGQTLTLPRLSSRSRQAM